SLVIASLGAVNDYGHMHAQAKGAYARHGIPWYRTDQNGPVPLRSPGTPGGGYTVTVERGTKNADGPSDRRSYQPDCVGIRLHGLGGYDVGGMLLAVPGWS